MRDSRPVAGLLLQLHASVAVDRAVRRVETVWSTPIQELITIYELRARMPELRRQEQALTANGTVRARRQSQRLHAIVLQDRDLVETRPRKAGSDPATDGSEAREQGEAFGDGHRQPRKRHRATVTDAIRGR